MILYGLYRATAKEHLDLNSFVEQAGFLSICFFPLGPMCCLSCLRGSAVRPLAASDFHSWVFYGNLTSLRKQGESNNKVGKPYYCLMKQPRRVPSAAATVLGQLGLPCWWLHTLHILQKTALPSQVLAQECLAQGTCAAGTCGYGDKAAAPFQRDPVPIRARAGFSTHPAPEVKGFPTAGVLSALPPPPPPTSLGLLIGTGNFVFSC